MSANPVNLTRDDDKQLIWNLADLWENDSNDHKIFEERADTCHNKIINLNEVYSQRAGVFFVCVFNIFSKMEHKVKEIG